MYHTIHYSSHNQCDRVRLLTSTGYTVCGDGRVGYKSQTIHFPSQIGYIRVYGERHGSRSEDINHSSLFDVLESVDGNGKSGSRSQIIPFPPIIQVILVYNQVL